MAAPLVPPCRDLLHALRQLATRGDASAQANASSAAAALLLRFVQGIGEGRGEAGQGHAACHFDPKAQYAACPLRLNGPEMVSRSCMQLTRAPALAPLAPQHNRAETFHNRGVPRPAEEREWFRVHPKARCTGGQGLGAAAVAAMARVPCPPGRNHPLLTHRTAPGPLRLQGEGVVLLRDGGLPAGTFVAEYLGELYPAWRWLERSARKGALAAPPLPAAWAALHPHRLAACARSLLPSPRKLATRPHARVLLLLVQPAGAAAARTAARCAWAPAATSTTLCWSGRRGTPRATTSCL